MATVGLDDTGARGDLGLSARVNESVTAIADAWISKEWNDEVEFGVIGGVRIKW